MRRKISMIIIVTGEVFSLIIPMSVVTVIATVIAVAPCALFAAFTGLIPMMTAVKCGILIGMLLACGALTAIVNHCRNCNDNCWAA